ncbi:MAG: nucleotidyl transferase AbiEii/AbiGii toxin family protein [Planctomycetes bacterium]|nr:nucleotidyl transferase AbiEii/AbiGii toxin family protein [Planctomycetota bacterium]
MIAAKCFTKTWIDAKRADLGGGDPVLVEKAIHAFALVGQLARRDIPFVFKGGTSLLLRLPRFRRLSIDVDILCPLPDADLDRILAEAGRSSPFQGYEEDRRDPVRRLPARRHFRFHYRPVDLNNPGPFVLLDVVKEEQIYPDISDVSIQTPLFEAESEVLVKVPTLENLLGDKLTAFAPNTVGIPCMEDSAMQVMKQIFDVGALFDAAGNFASVAAAYEAVFQAENGYREGRFTREQALSDTIETARRYCHYHFRGAAPHPHQELLERGRQTLQSHLIGASFTEPEAKVAAAKAAFLASALQDKTLHRLGQPFRYDPSTATGLAGVSLPDPVLQRLRGGNLESFHYWALAFGAMQRKAAWRENSPSPLRHTPVCHLRQTDGEASIWPWSPPPSTPGPPPARDSGSAAANPTSPPRGSRRTPSPAGHR